MKSLSISTHDKHRGFTLMEVIVAMGVFSILIGMGLYFSFDDYRGYLFRSEADLVVNVLQKARNQAMNNIGESAHGVHIDDTAYTLFQGAAYDNTDPTNQVFPANANIDVTDAEIIFEQLTGNASDIDLTVTDGFRVRTIEVTAEGRIDW